MMLPFIKQQSASCERSIIHRVDKHREYLFASCFMLRVLCFVFCASCFVLWRVGTPIAVTDVSKPCKKGDTKPPMMSRSLFVLIVMLIVVVLG